MRVAIRISQGSTGGYELQHFFSITISGGSEKRVGKLIVVRPPIAFQKVRRSRFLVHLSQLQKKLVLVLVSYRR